MSLSGVGTSLLVGWLLFIHRSGVNSFDVNSPFFPIDHRILSLQPSIISSGPVLSSRNCLCLYSPILDISFDVCAVVCSYFTDSNSSGPDVRFLAPFSIRIVVVSSAVDDCSRAMSADIYRHAKLLTRSTGLNPDRGLWDS